MTNSAQNNIPFVPENTIDPAAGLNLSINVIDPLLQTRVLTVGGDAPPFGSVNGDMHVVGTDPDSLYPWFGHANKLAEMIDGSWAFYDAKIVLNVADSSIYVNVSGTWSRYSGVISGTWSDIMDNVTYYKQSDVIHCTDTPTLAGSFWKVLVLDPGVSQYLLPLSGDCILGAPVNTVMIDDTTEQIVFQYTIPSRMIFPGMEIKASSFFEKSSGAIASTFRIRIGNAGDLTDDIVQSVSLQAASLSPSVLSNLRFINTSDVVGIPSTDDYRVDSLSAPLSPVTIDDTLLDTYITITTQNASSGAVLTLLSGSARLSLV